ncbi:MAG: ABC transporter ATP-binding protein [Gammaproteobacteria bacterium]
MSAHEEDRAAIEARGVWRSFGSRTVLRALDLRVAIGSSFALVGMNGTGKTTCIKALLDLAAADRGEIAIFGQPHNRLGARQQVAYLPERFLPPYYLKGGDFLRYIARLHGREHDEGAAVAMCERLDLDAEALRRPVREYSKGMAQKLGIASCLLSEKPLLILDEPLSGLDPKARLLTKRALLDLKARGTTLLFSTHMLHDVEEICDTMGILHGGSLRFVGTPGACVRQYSAESLEHAYLDCVSLTLTASAA